MALVSSGDGGCRTPRACGHDQRIGLQRGHVLGRCSRVESHLNGQALDLFHQVVQQGAVFGIGQGSEEEGAAQTVAALQQRHPVPAQRGHPRGFHATGAAAHHHHVARCGRGFDGRLELMAGQRVDGALHALVDEDLAHAGVAVDARPDVLRAVGSELDRDVRFGQHLARHGHEVVTAGGDVLRRQVGLDASGGDDRDAHGGLHSLRVGDKPARRVNQWRFGEGGAGRDGGVGGDADGVCPCRLAQLGRGHRIGQRDAAGGAQLLGIQPHPHRKARAAARLDGADHLQQQPGAVLQRATVLVLPLVVVRRQEARQDVGVGAVHLHTIKARSLRSRGGGGEELHHLRDVGLFHHTQARPGLAQAAHEGGHLLGGEGLQHVGLGVRWQRRHPHLPPGGQVTRGRLAGVLQLHGDLGAVRVHAPGQRGQPADELVARDPHLEGLGRARGESHRAHAHGQQPGPALGARLVVGLDALAATAVVLGEVGAHGGHHDAVAQLQAADAAGLEEGGKGGGVFGVQSGVHGQGFWEPGRCRHRPNGRRPRRCERAPSLHAHSTPVA